MASSYSTATVPALISKFGTGALPNVAFSQSSTTCSFAGSASVAIGAKWREKSKKNLEKIPKRGGKVPLPGPTRPRPRVCSPARLVCVRGRMHRFQRGGRGGALSLCAARGRAAVAKTDVYLRRTSSRSQSRRSWRSWQGVDLWSHFLRQRCERPRSCARLTLASQAPPHPCHSFPLARTPRC